MAKSSSERPRRRTRRCSHCGKDLPLRRARPAVVCPTCGAAQEYDAEDPLVRRQRAPAHEFHGPYLVGVIVGGILGLFLGLFFGALIYRSSSPGAVVLYSLLYGVGFAFLGCAFGFMTVGNWLRR
jgi:hypothetical protein